MRGQLRSAVTLHQVREQVQRRAHLVATVGGGLHDLGVGAEGRVVDERLPVDHPQVDPQFDAVGQGAQAERRVFPVQPQIQGEVIAGARADHHERQAVLGGDTRHQRLGTVTASHPQQVGAVGHRLPGYGGHVDRLGPAEEKHLGAKGFGLALEVELLHLPAAGLRVHDQVRMPGRGLRRVLGHAPVRQVAGQRLASGHARKQPDAGRHDGYPQHAADRENDDYRDRHQDEETERQPAHDAPPGEEEEGRRHAHDRGDQANTEHRQALQLGENHQDHDGQAGQNEAEARQPSLGRRALRTRHGRHGSWRRDSLLHQGSPRGPTTLSMVLASDADGSGTSPDSD